MGGWGGVGHTVTYIPRVGILISPHAFDPSISNSRREVNHLFLLIFDNYFLPGSEDLIMFFRKCQNPHPELDPPSPRA